MVGINLGEAKGEKFHYLYLEYLNFNSSWEVEPSKECHFLPQNSFFVLFCSKYVLFPTIAICLQNDFADK